MISKELELVALTIQIFTITVRKWSTYVIKRYISKRNTKYVLSWLEGKGASKRVAPELAMQVNYFALCKV